MKTCTLIIAFAGIILAPLVYASDPIAVKKQQLIQRQLMLQNQIQAKTQKIAQKTVQPQMNPVKVAAQTQVKPQVPAQQTQMKSVKIAAQTQAKQQVPTQQPQMKPIKAVSQAQPQQGQQKKIDLSAFAILPMQAWKEELKVPSTSNEGIEIIPYAVN
ncbi:MAG: hypothetical protein Q8S31_03290 [Alphaproteobacteria bacterium]|nr:hypothetical protein [Alphaproteobacteria bacterium]